MMLSVTGFSVAVIYIILTKCIESINGLRMGIFIIIEGISLILNVLAYIYVTQSTPF